MLCAMCVSIFQINPGKTTFPTVRGAHHTSIADVETAARHGCYLCSELVLDYDEDEESTAENGDSLQPSSLSFDLRMFFIASPNGRMAVLSFESADGRLCSAGYEIVYTRQLAKPEGYDVFLDSAKADLLSEPWRVRNDGFSSSQEKVADSTGDPKVLEVASNWLKRCVETHDRCKTSDLSSDKLWFPKRLLDLSSGAGQRLVMTAEEPPTERYATLSHCWGKNPICCLNADNVQEWRDRIPTDVLTQTFRDAIAATRMLNIRYIWIDSLCILQAGTGSKEDWQEHAVAMRLVYSNSLVNIAAARAECGADGAFASRSETFLRPCHILWQWPASHYEYEGNPFWTIRKPSRHQSHSIRTLPLYTRGWVVQERVLAPRVLHFGGDRVFWECAELSLVDESFPTGFQDSCPAYKTITQWPFDLSDVPRESSPTETDIQPVSDPMWALWQEMLNEYTRCDLSFPEKDIFIALAGIAERFGRYFGDEYIAGFFRKHLPFDLLWQNKGERAETYQGPSWSWASIDEGVQFAVGDCPYCDECCNRFAIVKDAVVELVNEEIIYGPVKRAELVLNGFLLPCKIEPAAIAGTGLRQRAAIYSHLSHDDVPPPVPISKVLPSVLMGEADIDDEDDSLGGFSTPNCFTAWALPIMEFKVAPPNNSAKHWGLLVKSAGNGKFERLGLYRMKEYVMAEAMKNNTCVKQDVHLI